MIGLDVLYVRPTVYSVPEQFIALCSVYSWIILDWDIVYLEILNKYIHSALCYLCAAVHCAADVERFLARHVFWPMGQLHFCSSCFSKCFSGLA